MKNFIKKIFILIIIIMICTLAFSRNVELGIFTTLVIVEEQENGQIKSSGPFSDGIFEELWKKNEYIFFDMSIDKPLSQVYDQLDIKPFLGVAEEAGADSILLVKFHYYSEDEGKGMRLKADNYTYNLYSINDLKSLKSGTKKLKINDHVDTRSKERTLKRIGMNVLSEIYR